MPLRNVHYRAVTDCGLLHVNAVAFEVCRQQLASRQMRDAQRTAHSSQLDEFNSWQVAVLAELGLDMEPHLLAAHAVDLAWRAKRSIYSRSETYKRRRAVQRRDLEARSGASSRTTATRTPTRRGTCLRLLPKRVLLVAHSTRSARCARAHASSFAAGVRGAGVPM